MERLRIDELRLREQERTGVRPSLLDISRIAFVDDLGRRSPITGECEPIAEGNARTKLSLWNRGEGLSGLRPRHLLRLSKHYGITDVNELLSE